MGFWGQRCNLFPRTVHVSVSPSLLSGGPWLAKIQGMHEVEEGNMVGGEGGHVLTR